MLSYSHPWFNFYFLFIADVEKESKELAPLKCYKCTSNRHQSISDFPFLPYHPNCESGHGLPLDFLIQCDNSTGMANVTTIYDTEGIQQRNAFISETIKESPRVMECGKFHSTKTNAIRRGCALLRPEFSSTTRRLFTFQDKVFLKDGKLSANYCMSPICNLGMKKWLSGAVLIGSLGASLAGFEWVGLMWLIWVIIKELL